LYYEGLSEFPSLDVVKQWEELDGGISNDAERKFLENSDIEKYVTRCINIAMTLI
jgi:hypothetical protein